MEQTHIKEKACIKTLIRGGLSVPSIMHKQESITIQTLRKIEDSFIQLWVSLYVYWFGLNLRFYCSSFLHQVATQHTI